MISLHKAYSQHDRAAFQKALSTMQWNQKTESMVSNMVMSMISDIRFSNDQSEKTVVRQLLAMLVKATPDSEEAYSIPAIMSASHDLHTLFLIFLLKGGSPHTINPRFLEQHFKQADLTQEQREVIDLAIAASKAGVPFKEYAESQGKFYSLDEVIDRLVSQVGGRRKGRSHKRKTRKGRKTHK